MNFSSIYYAFIIYCVQYVNSSRLPTDFVEIVHKDDEINNKFNNNNNQHNNEQFKNKVFNKHHTIASTNFNVDDEWDNTEWIVNEHHQTLQQQYKIGKDGIKTTRILYQIGNKEDDLPICAPNAVCSKIHLYETPWIERQCRCPKISYTAHLHPTDALPTYLHHQLSNTFDNTKHHRVNNKINITNHKANTNNNHPRQHHILSPLDSIGLTDPSSLEYDVDTINNDDSNDNIETYFQHMDISVDDDITGDNNHQHHHKNTNYNDYEIFDQYHDHRDIDNDDDISSGSSSSRSGSSSSNGIISDNVDDLYGKRKLRHRGDVQQLNGVCPSNIAADDGYTIADKTRQYKLCEPVYKLPQCRYFKDYTWTLKSLPELNITEQTVHCRCPKNSVTYLIKREPFKTGAKGYTYLFACSPQSRLRCQRKEPCKLFTVRKRQEFLEEVNTNPLCQCPRSHRCPKHHTDSGVILGKKYIEDNIRTYSGYCMPDNN